MPDAPERIRQGLDLRITLDLVLITTKGFAAPEVGQTYMQSTPKYGGATGNDLPSGTGRWPVRTAEPAVPLCSAARAVNPYLGVPDI